MLPTFWRRQAALASTLAAISVLAVCTRLHAQPSAADADGVRATILHLDGSEVVIDVGGSQVQQAQTLTVYRAIEVRHPITHKLMRDRFVIGTLRVSQTGATLSVAKVDGTPAHPFAVGDAVEAAAPKPEAAFASPVVASPAVVATAQASTGAQAPAAACTPGNPESVEEREIVAYWRATLSKSPEQRVALYNDFLQRRPASRYRAFVQGEIAYLRGADELKRTRAEAAARIALAASVTLLPLTAADESHVVELAALVRRTPSFRSLVLHARPLEQAGYQSFVMKVDARGHASVELPKNIVQAPGFAYFVELIDSAGTANDAVGSAKQPKLVAVKRVHGKSKPYEPNTRVRFTSEMVSFDGVSGRDWFLLSEGDFLYRVRYGKLYGVRVGYGNYRGEGGTVEQLDVQRLAPQPAGFSYGFVETQLELHRLFGLALRGSVGLGRPEDPNVQADGLTGGFQVRARIGAAEGTHLELAGELLPEIGQRAFLGLHWEAIENMPMGAEVVVTDQPVNSDELAVRLIYEVGYRFTDRFALALRPSYQLRTIQHAGPGVGLAATFDW